jgi:hypothetical protein
MNEMGGKRTTIEGSNQNLTHHYLDKTSYYTYRICQEQ